MIAPEVLQMSQIDLGDRGRTVYNRVEELAQSIKDNGLIQPIVLVPLEDSMFGLDAGGRRFKALCHLGVTTLYHASTSDPERPGYVLKGEDQATPLKRLFTEIAENLDREDVDWRDNMRLLTKAYRLSEAEANAQGKHVLMRDFGSMLGVGYAELQAAVAIHDDVVLHPDRYKDCHGIRAAYSLLLKANAEEMNRLAAERSLMGKKVVAKPQPAAGSVPAQDVPEPMEKPVIAITQAFRNVNGLEFLEGCPAECFDHIITDPDYAVSVDLLSSNIGGAAAGVAQSSVGESLSDLRRLIEQAWRVTRPQGFLVFWYDLDHHEKLQSMATSVGFAVQRWPLIWHKTDYRSNAAPAHNFCKNIEYAMVCRKPSAVLARAQTSCVYSCGSGDVVRELGHPFAKPYELWSWIYSAICVKGQSVHDPFAGRGSSSIAAMRWGLRPTGCEMVPEHYAGLIMNLQKAYTKELGNRVTFE